MRILLDESLPARLARDIVGHEVRTVGQMGWAGTRNGELLRRATGRFDVFLTADQSLEYQQSLSRAGIAVIVLVAVSNRIEALRPLVPGLLDALPGAQAGLVLRIGI